MYSHAFMSITTWSAKCIDHAYSQVSHSPSSPGVLAVHFQNTTSATLNSTFQGRDYEAGRHPSGFGIGRPAPSASSCATRLESFRILLSACTKISCVCSQTIFSMPISRYFWRTLSSPVDFPSQSKRYAPPPASPLIARMADSPSGIGMPTPPCREG